jgi:hypothetical protein
MGVGMFPRSAVLPTNPAPAHAPDQQPADRGAAPPTGAFPVVRVPAGALQVGDVLLGTPNRTVLAIVERQWNDEIRATLQAGIAQYTVPINTVNALISVAGGPTLLAAHLHPEHVEHGLDGFFPIYRPPFAPRS